MDKSVVFFLAVFFVAMLGSKGCIEYGTVDHVTATVSKTERVNDRESSKYLVFTNGETFQNTDTIWHGKWNSSDIHGRLQPGKSYRLKVNGFRVPFLSWYRNVLAVE